MIKRLYTFVFLMLMSMVVFADDQAIGLHLYTHHDDHQFCNETPGLYYSNSDGYTVGAYKNSECQKISVYAGKTFSTSGNVGLSLSVGAVTGYKWHSVVPMLVPSTFIRIPDTKVYARFALVPDDVNNILRYRNVHFSIENHF